MKYLFTIILLLFFLVAPISARDFGPIQSNKAAKIKTDTTNFNSILSTADTSVQKALDTLDNNNAIGSAWEVDSVGDLMPVEGTFSSVLWELDANDDLMPIS